MYIVLSWLHLVAATFWVGGMLFLSLVAVPLLKSSTDQAQAQRWFIGVARRFRTCVWGAIAILFITGTFLLSNHIDFASPSTWSSSVIGKLILVILLIVTSLSHDRIIGPKVRAIKLQPSTEWTSRDRILVRFAPWIGRMTMILGLAVVLAGVVLVRS